MQILQCMSVTFKFLLNKRRLNSKEEYPIVLRVYKRGLFKELAINEVIHVSHWNDELQMVLPTLPDHEPINLKISGTKSRLKKLLLLAELNNTSPELDDIIKGISPQRESQSKQSNNSIIKYGREQIKLLIKSGNIGNAFVYTNAVNKLREYTNTDNFPFQSLTYQKLTEFNAYMLSSGIKVNTASVYLRTLRAIYNRAIKEGIVSANQYPFRGFKIKNEKTISRSLTIHEMKSIANREYEINSSIWHWRNYFLLSFCLIGINFADLLKLKSSNIIDGRVVFRRSKTGKIYSIKLHDKTKELLSYYLNTDSDYLLPVLKSGCTPIQMKNDIKQAVKTCNDYLKRIAGDCSITKPISSYYARYSFANIARSLGYSKDIIAEALGHEYGNRVTGIYLDNYSNDVIDELCAKTIIAIFSDDLKK